MTTSVYFNHIESTPEQNLHQDLIIEAIKNYGIDVYYLPRKYVNEDLLYGEDTISEFNQAHLIEMYVKSVDGFEGEAEVDGSGCTSLGCTNEDIANLIQEMRSSLKNFGEKCESEGHRSTILLMKINKSHCLGEQFVP